MEPEFLLEIDEFTETLNSIGEIVSEDFSEDEVQMAFLNEGFFHLLGYERIGTDLRSELAVPHGRVDYITSGRGNTIRDMKTVVYEFKQPEKKLSRYVDQLTEYMSDTGAKFGVLTNGIRFRMYRKSPKGPKKSLDFSLASALKAQASAIILSLGYWSVEEQNIKPVAEAAAKEAVDTLPDELHLEFSESGIELFAEHFARYLRQELTREDSS